MSWFKIVNAAEKKARIDIYGNIGEFTDWWTGEKKGVAARDFSATLQALGDLEEIELHMNSAGGSVPDGIQIYNELKRHSALVTVFIDGQAASIASYVALAGDEIVMPANTTQWVHNPMSWLDQFIMGDSEDMRRAAREALNLADDLDTTAEILLNTYMDRIGDRMPREEFKAKMDAETIITAEQAVAWGLADRIEEPVQQVACHDMEAVRKSALTSFGARMQSDCHPANQLPPPAQDPPQAMDATALIVACRSAGFESLAPAMIEEKLAEPRVTERLALACDVNDLAAAGGMESIAGQLVHAAQQGPVAALRLALSMRMEDGEPVIRNDHGHETGRKTKTLNVYDIHDRRKAQRNKT